MLSPRCLPRLLPLSRRSFLLLLSPPPRLPLFSRFSSWSRRSGWLSLLSFRLPGLWLLLLRSRSNQERLKELKIPLP